MSQVHKETLQSVDNALPGRSGLDVEIFGMEGVPEDIVQQHNQRVIQQYWEADAERRAATGNPAPGALNNNPTKKVKRETPTEMKARLAEFKAKKAAQAAGGSSGDATPGAHSPAAYVSYPSLIMFMLSSRSRHVISHKQALPSMRISRSLGLKRALRHRPSHSHMDRTLISRRQFNNPPSLRATRRLPLDS